MENERPINIIEHRMTSLKQRETLLMAELAEVRMEMQRISQGQKPQDLGPVLPPRDIFWQRKVDYNQPRPNPYVLPTD